MKQKISIQTDGVSPITEMDLYFLSVYNVLYEKASSEPNKGIVASKGNPNQSKATWDELLAFAHSVEDYLRMERVGHGKRCETCSQWRCSSTVSPHLGECKLKNRHTHKWHRCKSWEE